MIQNVFFMLGQANSSMFPSFKEKSISSTSGPLFLFLSFFLSFVLYFFCSFFLSFFLSFCLSFFLHTLSLSLYLALSLRLSLSLSISSSSFMFFMSSFFWLHLFFGGSLISAPLSLSPCLRVLRAPSSCQPIHHCSSAPLYLGLLVSPFFCSLSVSSPLNARIQPLSAEDPWSCASKGLEAALKGVPAKTMPGIPPWTALLRKGKHRLESSLTLLLSNNLEGTFVRVFAAWRKERTDSLLS